MHPEVLTAEAAELAPALCHALAGMPFTLAGGTGLALQLGHRISVDFDWFCIPENFPRDLGRRLYELDKGIQTLQDRKDTFECLLCGVKCSFFSFVPRFEKPAEIFHGLPLAPVTDIAAMKLIAISQRGARKDYYDLYEVLKRTEFCVIVKRLTKMYAKPLPNPVHIAKSLVYFEDAEREPQPRLLHAVEWAVIRRFYEQHINEFTRILTEVLIQP